MKKVLIPIISLVASLASGVSYIDKMAAGANNGTSWADAYTTITNATTKTNGEFWIKGSSSLIYTSPPAGFNMRNTNQFYGGFVGTETLQSQRDGVANPTYLSGNLTNIVLDKKLLGTSVVDSCWIVNGFAGPVAGGISVLAGAIIVNSCYFTNNISSSDGGAIRLNDASSDMQLYNSWFSNNLAGNGGSAFRGGAGNNTITNCQFYNHISNAISTLGATNIFLDCLFSGNRSSGDAGIFSTASSLSNLFNRCTFVSNSCGGVGGVFYSNPESPISVLNCAFTNNWANQHGGVFRWRGISVITNCIFNNCYTTNAGVGGVFYELCNNQSHTFSDCTFINCYSSNNHGGAIYLAGTNEHSHFANCIFTNNRAIGNFQGGAIAAQGSKSHLDMIGCTFSNNFACNSGGAVSSIDSMAVSNSYFAGNYTTNTGSGGAIYQVQAGASNVIQNCAFIGNSASNGSGGGAIFFSAASTSRIVNCTFFTNRVDHGTPATAKGGAILSDNSGSVLGITNCIFWGNWSSGAGSNVQQSGTINVGYSDMMTNRIVGGTVVNGGGIFSVDPLFASATDVRLKSWLGRYNGTAWVYDTIGIISPCIDAGNPADDFSNEHQPNGGRINMGYDGNTTNSSISYIRWLQLGDGRYIQNYMVWTNLAGNYYLHVTNVPVVIP